MAVLTRAALKASIWAVRWVQAGHRGSVQDVSKLFIALPEILFLTEIFSFWLFLVALHPGRALAQQGLP